MNTTLLAGLEIGGTKLQAVIGKGDGSIVARHRSGVDPSRGALGILEDLTAGLKTLASRIGVAVPQLAALGVGFGGPVDAAQGITVRSHQVAGWVRFPLAAFLRERFDIALVAVQNDADTAALAEARYGAGVGLSPILYANSGSGVGSGLIVDGRIYRGGSGIGALELGHLRVFPDEAFLGGRPDFAVGVLRQQEGLTLEQVASGWAIGRVGADYVRINREHGQEVGPALVALSNGDPERVTARVVAEAAALGDDEAIRILDDATTAFAQALAHAVTLLAPRRIVLGGGVSLIPAEWWLDPIRRKLDAQVFSPFRGTFDVVAAALGEDVVTQGTLALAHDLVTLRSPHVLESNSID